MAHTSTNAPTKAAEFIVAHNRNFEEEVLQLQKSTIIRSQQILSSSVKKITGLNNSVVNKSKEILTHHKEQLLRIRQLLTHKGTSVIISQRTILLRLSQRITTGPLVNVKNKLGEIQHIQTGLKTNALKLINVQNKELTHFTAMVKMMSPKNVLKKGFVMVSMNGKIIKNADTVREGTELLLTFAASEIKTKVISKTKMNGNEHDL